MLLPAASCVCTGTNWRAPLLFKCLDIIELLSCTPLDWDCLVHRHGVALFRLQVKFPMPEKELRSHSPTTVFVERPVARIEPAVL